MASKQRSIRSKIRRSSGFRNLLWEFNVSEIETKVAQIKNEADIHHLYKEGFNNLRAGFEEFLTENDLDYDNRESGYFKIYSSVAIESTDIIRIAVSFYGNKWFSNVVTSENTMWYRKVYILNFIIGYLITE